MADPTLAPVQGICDLAFENHLLENWTAEMQKQIAEFKEPILDEFTMNIIKIACDTLKQDLHVFFLTADILENYIHKKDGLDEYIADPVLAIGAVIFLTAKYFGAGCEVKMQIVIKFLNTVTSQTYSINNVMRAEQEIMNTLDHRLPFTTILDDLNTCYDNFTKKYLIKPNFKNLCLEIMQMIYLFKKSWFDELKKLYHQEMQIFRYLICSKYYLTTGILITSLQLTNHRHSIDLQAILEDLKDITKIHPDHIYALCGVIWYIIKDSNNIMGRNY